MHTTPSPQKKSIRAKEIRKRIKTNKFQTQEKGGGKKEEK
jgi:hypothetical protein